MAALPTKLLANGLPDVERLITSHNAAGKAIFSNDIPSNSAWEEISPAANFFLAYTTKNFPVNLNAPDPKDPAAVPADIQSYQTDINTPFEGGLSLGNGELVDKILLLLFRKTISLMNQSRKAPYFDSSISLLRQSHICIAQSQLTMELFSKERWNSY
jgi:hypothetical protein